jgi:signal transduction histidine kinase
VEIRALPSQRNITGGYRGRVDALLTSAGLTLCAAVVGAGVLSAGWVWWQTRAGESGAERSDRVTLMSALRDPAVIGALGIAAASGTGCALMLAASRRRTLGVTMVRDALAAASAGESSVEALLIDERFGPEARAWNDLVREREIARTRELTHQAEQAMAAGDLSRGSAELGAAFDAMWVGLLVLDYDGAIKFANGACVTLLGRRKEDLIGASASAVFDDPALSGLVKKALDGGCKQKAIHERVVDVPGASRSSIRFTFKSLRKDDGAAVLVVIDDTTQQKVAEESRSSFAAQVTHELRTPLTNIRLYVETLVEDESNDPQTRAKCLNVITSEVRRLERVVSDMLSVSEMEAGSVALRRDDVRTDALFEELECDYRAAAQDKEITLAFELPPKMPVLQADRDKLAMALHNLVGNAIKYTPVGGCVKVVVLSDGASMTVEVKDNGIGIRAEECERVFEKFYRAKDKRIAGITGSGLGLAIAREVMRLHGGDITVSSQIDRGSTFTLTVPIGRGESESARRAA